MQKTAVVIVAGGQGMRMGGAIPKQFMLLKGVPVLGRTLFAVYKALPAAELVVVLPVAEHGRWNVLCREYGVDVPHRIAAGGDTRCQSVRNGLAAVAPDRELILVHDGVRPFVSKALTGRLLEACGKYPGAVPVVPLVDSIREVLPEGGSRSADREHFRAVQTPQAFRAEVLRAAYAAADPQTAFGDDASLVECAGYTIGSVEGERNNIKITTPYDMEVAAFICESFL